MKAKANRLLSLILALAMCLSMVQGVAFATENTYKEPKAVTIEGATDVKVAWDKGNPNQYTITYKKDNKEETVDGTVGEDNTETINATCKEAKKIVYHLKVNGQEYTNNKAEGEKLTNHPAPEDPEKDVKWNITKAATCEGTGTKTGTYKCKVCGETVDYNDGKAVMIDALGHNWEIKFEATENVDVKNGVPQTAEGKDVKIDPENPGSAEKAKLGDGSKEGYYTWSAVCKNDASHKVEANDETTKVVTPPTTSDDKLTEYSFDDKSNLTFVTANFDEVEGKQNTYNLKDGEEVKYTVTDDSQDAYYYKQEYKDATTPLGAKQKIEVKAGHNNTVTVIENVSKTVTVTTDDKGKAKIVNNDCTQKGTYELVTYCMNDHKAGTEKRVAQDVTTDTYNPETGAAGEKAKAGWVEMKREKKTVETATHVAKKDPVPDPKTDTATCKEAGKVEVYQVCANCGKEIEGTRKEVDSPKKEHLKVGEAKYEEERKQWTTKKENEKEPTATQAGSYDLVTYCQYGVEHDRQTIAVNNTGKYTYEYELSTYFESLPSAFVASKANLANPIKDQDYAISLLKGDITNFATLQTSDNLFDKLRQVNGSNGYIQVKRVVKNADATEDQKKLDAKKWIGYKDENKKDVAPDMQADGDNAKLTITVEDGEPAYGCKNGSKKVTVTVAGLKDGEVELPALSKTYTVAYNDVVADKDWVKNTDKNGMDYFTPTLADHTFGEETRKVTKEATETEDGEAVWTKTCSVCGKTETRKESISKTGKKDEEKKDEEKKDEEKKDEGKKEETPAPAPAPVKAKINISKAVIKGSAAYTGKAFEVPFTVTLNGKKLTEGKDFKLTNGKENNFTGVGKHKVVAEGMGDYTGSAVGYLTIKATKQNIKVTPAKKTLKAKALKKKAASFSVKVKGAKGKVTLKSKSKKVTVKGKKITVKKGTKKGTYKVTVNVAKKGGFKAAKKTITIKVK